MKRERTKLSTVIRAAIERSLEIFVANDSISAEDMFDDLRDMYSHYEEQLALEEFTCDIEK